MSVNTKRISVHISEDLDHSQREDLVVRMEHQPGIELALIDPDDPHGLTVEYCPDRFSEITLQDFLSLHGAHAKIISM